MLNVLKIPLNTVGRDIITGDIHGAFALLKKALILIKFNPSYDRLIIAGDLVDRGKNSLVAAQWVTKPWCFPIMGNHDAQYAFINDSALFSKGLVCTPADPWYVNISEAKFKTFCTTFRKNIYPAIEIETKVGKVGVIHAEVPIEHTWSTLVKQLNDKDYDLFHECIWSRKIANLAQKNVIDDRLIVPDVHHVFHGHSYSKGNGLQPFYMANRYYIDTAAYKAEKSIKSGEFPDASLMLFDVSEPLKPLYVSTAH